MPWPTVRENLTFGLNGESASDHSEIVEYYARIVGLQGFEDSFPHELSGGMLKRTELARALVVKPEVLFMDEPFSAVDALMSLRVRNEPLRILRTERHTVILVCCRHELLVASQARLERLPGKDAPQAHVTRMATVTTTVRVASR
jgi:ABC-type nitrate/sulfonate/bicarbonate transport system ATPase subunit